MSVELEPRTRPVPELDAEQEVDFGRYLGTIAGHWWLLLVGALAGALIGYLASLGRSANYRAASQVYLGQPLAPGAGGPVTSVPTTLGLVTNLLESDATIRAVAAKVGLKPGRLRGHVSLKPLVGVTGAKLGTPAPLLEITVTGSPARKVAAASNELAGVAVNAVSAFINAKLRTLNAKLARDARELKKVDNRIATAQAEQQRVFRDASLTSVEKLIFIANLNNVLTFNEQRRSGLEVDQLSIPQLVSLAKDVEAGRIVSPAVASRARAPSRRTGIAIGAFVGLIVGIVAGLAWEPLARRIAIRT